jgi:Ca-activated chloride channel family protein
MLKVISVCCLLLLISQAYAASSAKTIIILDASNSMWGKVSDKNGKKKAKIDIAKSALKEIVEQWDDEKGELGITVYGHRKKSDCNDIEAIVPVGIVDKTSMFRMIDKVQPKGKTPIAKALEQEATKLKKSGKAATIILISDGIDSCKGDPCKTAKRFKKDGINITAHVVAFDVNKKEKKKLQCIAEATNGIIADADNEKELKKVVEGIIQPIKIKAVDDVFDNSLINGKVGGTIGDVTDNDEYNETKADDRKIVSEIVETPKNVALSIDDEGKLFIGENTPEGNYTAKYKICEKSRRDNCSEATVKFTVKNIKNTNILAHYDGQEIKANYLFFKVNNNGEADEKLEYACSSDIGKACVIDLPKGNYIVYAISEDKKGDTLLTVGQDKVLTKDDIQKIIINLH